MNFGAGLPEFGSVSDEKSNHCVLTTSLRGFSSCSQQNAAFTEYVTEDEEFKDYFQVKFYANGSCSSSKGYVSIIFHGGDMLSFIIFFSKVKFTCVAAVIDIAGNKRFLQTLAYDFDPNSPNDLENGAPKFGLDKFISRDSLLSDSSELLPNDCLTLCLEIDYLVQVISLDLSPCIIEDSFVQDGDKYYISIDSSFGKDLCKMCSYFQRLSETPMIENKTRRALVPSEELKSFQYIFLIVSDADVKIETVIDVCDLYVVADKYDIQPVIETCRQLVKSFLCAINVPEIQEHVNESITLISELAEKYGDESLREIVAIYLDSKHKLEASEYEYETYLNKVKTEWNCEYEKINESNYFKLSKRKSKEPPMEFYQ